MALKIIGGILKGLTLAVPAGDLIRPTSVMLKRKIFDANQNLDEKIFIDACAGTGAMGFEAWSRGAKKVYLIEANKSVFSLLRKNYQLIKTKFAQELKEREINIVCDDIENWIKYFKKNYNNNEEETIIFFDPPYQSHDLYQNVADKKIINASSPWYNGQVWIESDELKGVPISFWPEYNHCYYQGSSYIIQIILQ